MFARCSLSPHDINQFSFPHLRTKVLLRKAMGKILQAIASLAICSSLVMFASKVVARCNSPAICAVEVLESWLN